MLGAESVALLNVAAQGRMLVHSPVILGCTSCAVLCCASQAGPCYTVLSHCAAACRPSSSPVSYNYTAPSSTHPLAWAAPSFSPPSRWYLMGLRDLRLRGGVGVVQLQGLLVVRPWRGLTWLLSSCVDFETEESRAKALINCVPVPMTLVSLGVISFLKVSLGRVCLSYSYSE